MNHKSKINLIEITGQITTAEHLPIIESGHTKKYYATSGKGGKIHVSQTTSVFGFESDWLSEQNPRSD